jgi:RimJ/RimL family protein N-acetyltransferase
VRQGRLVTLREFTAADAAEAATWTVDPFNDFGQVEARWLSRSDIGRLVVVRRADDRAVGHVSWHQVHYGPNPESAAWNIGIGLVPEARGRGLGSEAQRLLAQHLFATTPLQRVEAVTDVENAAEQGALARAGFTREGVLRSAQFRAGRWRDAVIWSLLRGEV